MLEWDRINLRQVFVGGLLLTISIVMAVFESILSVNVGALLMVSLWSGLSVVSLAIEVNQTETSCSSYEQSCD